MNICTSLLLITIRRVRTKGGRRDPVLENLALSPATRISSTLTL
jgi:hypothetical protein